TLCRETFAQGTDLSLQGGIGLVSHSSWSVRTSPPIHACQRPLTSPIQPTLHRAQSHAKTPRHLSSRPSPPDQRNYLPSSLLLTFSSDMTNQFYSACRRQSA